MKKEGRDGIKTEENFFNDKFLFYNLKINIFKKWNFEKAILFFLKNAIPGRRSFRKRINKRMNERKIYDNFIACLRGSNRKSHQKSSETFSFRILHGTGPKNRLIIDNFGQK